MKGEVPASQLLKVKIENAAQRRLESLVLTVTEMEETAATTGRVAAKNGQLATKKAETASSMVKVEAKNRQPARKKA
jgi:hypothetical protein